MTNETNNETTRRQFLKVAGGVAVAAAAVSLLPRSAHAAGLPHLKPSMPAAVGLGYVDNTKQANQKKYPHHTDAQRCDNCAFYKGNRKAEWGPCEIFPGYAVHTPGWCSAHKLMS